MDGLGPSVLTLVSVGLGFPGEALVWQHGGCPVCVSLAQCVILCNAEGYVDRRDKYG